MSAEAEKMNIAVEFARVLKGSKALKNAKFIPKDPDFLGQGLINNPCGKDYTIYCQDGVMFRTSTHVATNTASGICKAYLECDPSDPIAKRSKLNFPPYIVDRWFNYIHLEYYRFEGMTVLEHAENAAECMASPKSSTVTDPLPVLHFQMHHLATLIEDPDLADKFGYMQKSLAQASLSIDEFTDLVRKVFVPNMLPYHFVDKDNRVKTCLATFGAWKDALWEQEHEDAYAYLMNLGGEFKLYAKYHAAALVDLEKVPGPRSQNNVKVPASALAIAPSSGKEGSAERGHAATAGGSLEGAVRAAAQVDEDYDDDSESTTSKPASPRAPAVSTPHPQTQPHPRS